MFRKYLIFVKNYKLLKKLLINFYFHKCNNIKYLTKTKHFFNIVLITKIFVNDSIKILLTKKKTCSTGVTIKGHLLNIIK